MNRLYLYISSLFMLVIAVFYFLQTKNRRESLAIEQMSKKLRAKAHFVVDDQMNRQPAGLSPTSGAGPQDRWVSALFFAHESDSTKVPSLKLQMLQKKSRERRLALEALKRSGSKISSDGIGVLSKFRAIPRARVENDDLAAQHAMVLNESWAIFDAHEMPRGSPVVYDFNKDRWGVMTGMVEVSLSHTDDINDAKADLESQGYKVIKPAASRDELYVFSGSKNLDKINQVSRDLKNRFGPESVNPETIFVWRGAE